MKTLKQTVLVIASTAVLFIGCKTMSRQDKGVLIGAAGGGVVGGVIGKVAGNTAMGAVIGAAVGGVAGGIIGRKMDKQAEEMKEVLKDAEVKRVGEGIVIEFRDKVLFGFDRSDLTSSARGSLDKLADVLKRYPDTNIEILGHTDSIGTARYNERLSERRANSAASYLRSVGISRDRLKTRGLGESDPIASNETEDGRAENRRVEFVITANEKMIQDAKREAGEK